MWVDIFTRGTMIFVNEVGWSPSNHQWWLGFTSISLETIHPLPPVFLSVEAVMISSPLTSIQFYALIILHIGAASGRIRILRISPIRIFFGSCQWWVLLHCSVWRRIISFLTFPNSNLLETSLTRHFVLFNATRPTWNKCPAKTPSLKSSKFCRAKFPDFAPLFLDVSTRSSSSRGIFFDHSKSLQITYQNFPSCG